MSRGGFGGPGGFGGGGGFGGTGMSIGPLRTPQVIKDIILVTGGALILQWVLSFALPGGASSGRPLPFVVEFGALRPSYFFRGMIWQPFTTLFLHAEFMHFAGNMFFLWMFGSPVAESWGRRRFLALYFGAGALGGLLQVSLALLVHIFGLPSGLLPWDLPTIGASGAVFGVVAVYCFSWPDRNITLLFLPISLEARWLLPLEFLAEFGFAWKTVSHAAHLCGVAVGWWWLRRGGPGISVDSVVRSWRQWRRSVRSRKLRVVGDDARGGPDEPMFH